MAGMGEIFDLAVVIEAIDKFSGPLKAMESSMASADVRMKAINKTMKNMGSSASDIRRVEEALRGLQVEDNFAKMANDLERIGASSAEIDRLRQSYTQFAQEQEHVNKLHSQMGKWGKVGLVGAGVTVAGGVMADGLLHAVDAAGRLQTSMLNVQSALKLTNAEMQKATDLSQTVGIPTMWSSEQMGTIMQTMANSGLTKQQVLDPKTLKQYASFAEVQYRKSHGTIGPEESIKSAVQMAHMYQVYNSKQLTPFLNQVNAALLHTTMTPSEFATQFKYFAGQAKAMGMSSQQALTTNAWLDRIGLHNSGRIFSSDFLQRLIYHSSGSKADAAMRAAGFVTGASYVPAQYHVGGHYDKHGKLVGGKTIKGHYVGGRSIFTDSHGNFVGMPKAIKILQDFNKRFGGNSNKTTPLLIDMLGKQGYRIAKGAMSSGSLDQYNNVQKQIKNTASISATQDRLNKSWEGQTTQFKTTMKDLEQVFGQSLMTQLLPALKALTTFASKLLAFSKAHKQLVGMIATFAAITAGILLAGGALTLLIGSLGMTIVSLRLIKSTQAFKSLASGIKTGSSLMKDFTSNIKIGASIAKGSFVNNLRSAGRATLDLGKSSLKAAANIAKTTAVIVANTAKTVAMKSVQLTVMAATKTWSAIQIAFNAIMMANPISLIIVGIAALIAIIIIVVTHFKTVSKWVQNFWHWLLHLKDGVLIAIAAFAPFIGLPVLIIKHWQQIKTWFSGLVKDMKSIGHNIVEGLANGILGAGAWFQNKIGSFVKKFVTGPFRYLLKINSPSKVFAEHGMYIVQGLAQGIDNHGKTAEDSVKGLARRTMDGMSGIRGTSTGAANNQPIVIQVYASPNHDEEAIADKVVKKLGRVSKRMTMNSGVRLNIQSMG